MIPRKPKPILALKPLKSLKGPNPKIPNSPFHGGFFSELSWAKKEKVRLAELLSLDPEAGSAIMDLEELYGVLSCVSRFIGFNNRFVSGSYRGLRASSRPAIRSKHSRQA